ncbi:MAG: ABC transporter permease subunit [Anaerolineae bacterium]|nr:ABC transporter permease subunit [Anaerolineae bacterium]MCO5193468.1 ABC transporter permease subunit [Anaerolineae bacterium]MCO5204950.1 ABC transporter permease subunit [Anaerolineae bacterium]
MTTSVSEQAQTGRSTPTATITGMLLRLILLGVFDIGAVWLITGMFFDGYWPLAAMLAFITIAVNIIFLREGMYPLRWMAVGLSLLLLISVYPIFYTVYLAFTNYSDGYLLTKQQVIDQKEGDVYLPETGQAVAYTAYRSPDGNYVLWLQSENPDSPLNNVLAEPDVDIGESTIEVGDFDENGIPNSVAGYERIPTAGMFVALSELDKILFGGTEQGVQVRGINEASQVQQRFVYDPGTDTITDQQTGIAYAPVNGQFVDEEGNKLPQSGGFIITVGLDNFSRFFGSSAIGGPLFQVIVWNFAFAFLTVLMTFFLGLFTALLFNDLPGKKIIRSLLIVPYTIPSLVTILVWKGMLNEQIGVFSNVLQDIFGSSPPFFTNPTWTRFAILTINLWLGYPYFMLVCSGALQGIPQDIYSAADVDGANAFTKFRKLTLPLLLVAVGPLLVASFTFNFNNFNVIYLFNKGGPPIPGADTPVGYTDILISYVYKLAFGGARGSDYGLASAITIIIFVVVMVITLLQFRYTNMWEAGEDV